jgi:hypothetical protein
MFLLFFLCLLVYISIIFTHALSLSFSQQMEENKLLTQAILSTDSPLNLVENRYFKEFMLQINQSYILPSLEMVKTYYLSKEENLLRGRIDDFMKQREHLTLICNFQAISPTIDIMHILIATIDVPFYYDSLIIADGTGGYVDRMEAKICAALDHFQPQKFIAIISNSVTKLDTAREKVEAKYPHLFVYGCLNSELKALLNDCIQSSFLQKTIEFCNNIIVKSKLDDSRMHDLHVLHERDSFVDISNFIVKMFKNKKLFLTLCPVDNGLSPAPPPVDLGTEYRSTVDKVFKRLQNIHGFLSEIWYWIQIDNVVLGMINPCQIFYKLDIFLKALGDDFDELQTILAQRRKTGVLRVHKAMDILHPKFLGRHLQPPGDDGEANEFIYTLAQHYAPHEKTEIMVDYAEYKTQSEFFAKKFLWETCDIVPPITWWNAFCRHTSLNKVAVKILSLPVTLMQFDDYLKVVRDTQSMISSEEDETLVFIRNNFKVSRQDHGVSVSHVYT